MSSQNPNEQDDNQEKNNEEENLDNDVVQNSQDDITEDEEDYETGKNMLLAYYDKVQHYLNILEQQKKRQEEDYIQALYLKNK